MSITPIELEVLIYHYCSPEPYPYRESPAGSAAIKKFREDGIFNTAIHPQVTDKGKAWLKLILDVPYPRQVFVDQNNNVIEL